MLMKKLPVQTTPCGIKDPPLRRGKIGAKPGVASSRLAVAINGILNGLVSFVWSERITSPHLNGKLAFAEDCVHFWHSYRNMTHVVQEWDEVARIVLAIIRKWPRYHLFNAREAHALTVSSARNSCTLCSFSLVFVFGLYFDFLQNKHSASRIVELG